MARSSAVTTRARSYVRVPWMPQCDAPTAVTCVWHLGLTAPAAVRNAVHCAFLKDKFAKTVPLQTKFFAQTEPVKISFQCALVRANAP